MNSIESICLLALVLEGAMMLLLPHFSPRRFLFAITVPPAFRGSESARAALRRYHWTVAGAIVVAVVIVLVHVSAELAFAIAGPIPIVGGLGAFLIERGRIRRQAPPMADVREADLSPEADHLPRWFSLALPPFAAPAAAAAYLRAHWAEIPERFPTHYGVNGPDRWADKTSQAVFEPLLFSSGMMLLLLLLSLAMFFGSRRTPQRVVILKIMVGGMYLFAFLFCALSLEPLLGISLVWLFLPTLVFVVVAIAWAFRTVRNPDAPGEATPDNCWILGSIYYNPQDPAIFVQKRIGFGYTFNFGNRWCWIVLGGFAAGMIGLAIALPRGH